MARPLALLLAATAMMLSAPAIAGTVYSQPGDGQACTTSCWTSDYGTDGMGANFQAFDDFSLSTAAGVTTVSWQGFYYDYVNTANNPVAPATTDWQIGFYADNGGLPGSALYTDTLPAASVTAAFLGTSLFVTSAVNVYDFTATLGSAFNAAAGTTYWFSPLSIQPDGNPLFSWSPAAGVYDGYSAQESPAGGTAVYRSDDRAFSLSAGGVPEPASWTLMILGCGAIGATTRRRTARAAA